MSNDLPRIVFLVSLPRSGSTLLQAILGTHSDIHTNSEPWLALGLLSLGREEAGDFDFNLELAQRTQKAFLSEIGITDEEVRDLNRIYLHAFYKKAVSKTGKSVFVDKTPRYYEILPELHETFPDARFVLLHRNPLDTAASILATWVKKDFQNLIFYQRDFSIAISKINAFERMAHSNVISLNFEDLLSNPSVEVERICQFLGVDFQEDMLNYNSQVSWEFGDKNFKNFNGINASNNSSNLRELDVSHQQLLKSFVQSLPEEECEEFGYSHSSLNKCVAHLDSDDRFARVWNRAMDTAPYEGLRIRRWRLNKTIEALLEPQSKKQKKWFWKK